MNLSIYSKNIFLILSLGVVLSLSVAINSFFTTFKELYFPPEALHNELIGDIIFIAVLLVILFLLVYLYSGSLDVQTFKNIVTY